MAYKHNELQKQLDSYFREANEHKEKKERAQKSAAAKLNNMKALNLTIEENSARDIQIKLDREKNLEKTYLSAIL